MSSKILTATIGALCAAGLAVSGVGWYAGEKPHVDPPKQAVYCNINELIKYHPAWDQYVQLTSLPSRTASTGDSINTDTGQALSVDKSQEPSPVSGDPDREGLRTDLEQRLDGELLKVGDKLSSSLDARLSDRRQEMLAVADAEEADARRKAEQALADNVRAVDESVQYDRLDAQIKLAALKSQLSALGVADTGIKNSIAAREKALEEIRARVSQDQASLRGKTDAEMAALRKERLAGIDTDIAGMRQKGEEDIAWRLQLATSSLEKDLEHDVITGIQLNREISGPAIGRGAAPSVGNSALTSARLQYNTAAGASLRGGAAAAEIKARMLAELKIVVKHLAEERGSTVTFEPGAGAKDVTSWFKTHLPYGSARKSG